MKYEFLIITFGGIFSIVGAIANWDWFMNHRKAQLWVKLFGRDGARIFYGVLGMALLVIGSVLSFGV